MSQLQNGFKTITGVILSLFGLMFTFIGFIGLKDSGGMFFVLLILALSGLLLLYSGIRMILVTRQQQKREEQLFRFIAANPKGNIPAEPTADNPLIASWHIESSLWQKFRRAEMRNRNVQSYVILGFMAVFLLVIFIPVMGAAWFVALPVSGLLLLLAYIILKARTAQLTKYSPVGMTVYFAPSGLMIGAEYIPFYNDNRWLDAVHEKQEEGYSFLEFTLKWKTSKGAIGRDEVNIPFTEAERGQVEKVRAYYREHLSKWNS